MWVLVASIPPLMWSFNNLADEYLAKHHFAKNAILLVLLSACFEMIPALGGMIFHEPAQAIPLKDGLILGLMGFWLSLSFVPYIFALQLSNAGNVIPIFQTIPVFAFFLGWFFLGETATALQIVAALMIIVAAAGVSWNYRDSKIDMKPLGLMLLSSFMISLYLIAGRYYTFQYDPISMNIWLWAGSGLLSLCCVLSKESWRKKSLTLFQSGHKILLSVFFFQIAFQIGAAGLWIMALSIAPSAALMDSIGGLHPAYVLLLGLILGKLYPRYFETVSCDRILLIKLALIAIMAVGIYLIAQ